MERTDFIGLRNSQVEASYIGKIQRELLAWKAIRKNIIRWTIRLQVKQNIKLLWKYDTAAVSNSCAMILYFHGDEILEIIKFDKYFWGPYELDRAVKCVTMFLLH